MEVAITDEQKEMAKKAQEFSKKQLEANNEDSEVCVMCHWNKYMYLLFFFSKLNIFEAIILIIINFLWQGLWLFF